ncbi:Proton-coupled amino acid transporter 1-like [Oopsacas minuta]|uniref:Proton-coupled amino acid transporter 1-like n=1 Tax=Oopsacas minuta TaxID=111878 RepID=A0AAV7K1J8_9METZ|nr:Proton-coupled amino acid transporter 1-like [Oopsacas minuta]
MSFKHYIKLLGNIFISFMGAGILGLPYAFRHAGLLHGSIILVIVCFISVVGMLTLLDIKNALIPSKNSDKNPDVEETHDHVELEFREVGQYAFGSIGLLMVEVAIVLSQVGFCCAYLIFITEAIGEYFPQFPKLCYLVIILIPLFFLVSIQNLNSLGLFSIFANLITLTAYTIVLASEVDHLLYNEPSNNHQTMFNLTSFPFFFSVSIYCYEGAGLIFSLESSPHKSIRHHFRPIFITSMAIITIIYIVFGACGYLAYGELTEEIITSNLEGLIPTKVKLFLSVSLLFTYPVMMFPVSIILDRRLNLTEQFGSMNILIRTLLVVLTGCIIILIPQFSTLMELVGATLCTMLNFIFPGLFYLAIIGKGNGMLSVIKSIGLIVFGVIGMIVGTQDVLRNFL